MNIATFVAISYFVFISSAVCFYQRGCCLSLPYHQPDFIYLAALRLDKMTMTYK